MIQAKLSDNGLSSWATAGFSPALEAARLLCDLASAPAAPLPTSLDDDAAAIAIITHDMLLESITGMPFGILVYGGCDRSKSLGQAFSAAARDAAISTADIFRATGYHDTSAHAAAATWIANIRDATSTAREAIQWRDDVGMLQWPGPIRARWWEHASKLIRECVSPLPDYLLAIDLLAREGAMLIVDPELITPPPAHRKNGDTMSSITVKSAPIQYMREKLGVFLKGTSHDWPTVMSLDLDPVFSQWPALADRLQNTGNPAGADKLRFAIRTLVERLGRWEGISDMDKAAKRSSMPTMGAEGAVVFAASRASELLAELGAIGDGDGKGPEPQPAGKQLSKEAKALAALVDHPEWTDQQVADAAGCNRGTLFKMLKYVAAKRQLKSGRDRMPKGRKDRQTGDLDA